MPRVEPINKAAQVTLDASGNGRVSIGPTQYGQSWHDLLAAVSVSSNTEEATCALYVGTVNPGNLVDSTYTGSSGDRSDVPYPLTPGSPLWAVWTGGDALATATLSVFGKQTVE